MGKITKKGMEKAIKGTGGILSAVAKNLNVTRHTVYKFLDKHPEFQEKLDQEREAIVDLAEGSLFSQVKNREAWATKYLLSTKGKSRGYVEKQELEHSGDGVVINVNIPKEVKELLDGELRSNS